MYRWCSLTIRIIVTCKGLVTGDDREGQGGGLPLLQGILCKE